ncbi:Chitinase 11 [Carabus blaptoides fortunei]
MSNIPVPQARYELLKDETKTRFVTNKRICLVSAIVLLSFAFAGIIILIVNLQYFINGFRLPDYYQPQEFPSQWVQRAIKYNSFDETTVKKELPEYSHKNYRYKNLPDFKLVCYYSIPNQENGDNSLHSNQIDPNLCTHINVGFVSVKNNTIELSQNANQTLQNISSLKRLNKNLKVLISVGGGGDESEFPEMVLNHANRKMFIRSAVSILKEFKLDGIDLDWEFPNENQKGDHKQRMHFSQLLNEIRQEIKRHAEKHRFLLTVAVAAPRTIVDNSYDVSYMNEYVDFVNVMSYDYHFYTKLTPYTGLNAPLYARANEKGFLKTMNINSTAFYWHESGMDKAKIIVGLPTYGHSFQLVNPSNNGLTAPASGYGKIGTFGFVDYSDICWFLTYYQIKAMFDLESKSPYACKGTEWISFEDMQSVSYKTEFIKDNNFGGAMILSLNTDDHKGNCGTKFAPGADETFPLTRKVKSILYDDQL